MEDNNNDIFLEIDQDLRRIGAVKSAYLPVCLQGENCVRKNVQHFREFRHPVQLNRSDVSLTIDFKKKKNKKVKSEISVGKIEVKRAVLKCQLPTTVGSLPYYT